MKKSIFLFIIMFSFFSNTNAQYKELASSFSFNGIDGKIINLNEYKNKVIVVVNVASRCVFTTFPFFPIIIL